MRAEGDYFVDMQSVYLLLMLIRHLHGTIPIRNVGTEFPEENVLIRVPKKVKFENNSEIFFSIVQGEYML